MTSALPVAEARPHDHHEQIQARLRKAAGQLNGVAVMHAQGRDCVDVLDQLAAVNAAVDAVALLLLGEHIDGCVRDAVEAGDPDVMASELLSAVRRYVRNN